MLGNWTIHHINKKKKVKLEESQAEIMLKLLGHLALSPFFSPQFSFYSVSVCLDVHDALWDIWSISKGFTALQQAPCRVYFIDGIVI